MPERNDLLIGQIALEWGLVTQEQIRAALQEQARQKSPKPIGVVLIGLGFLTNNQLAALIDEHRRRTDEPAIYAEIREEDIVFGERVVSNGRATQEQVDAGLRRQQELAEEGAIHRLGEILGLSDEAAQATLKEQGKSVDACPACGARSLVAEPVGTELRRCERCGIKAPPIFSFTHFG